MNQPNQEDSLGSALWLFQRTFTVMIFTAVFIWAIYNALTKGDRSMWPLLIGADFVAALFVCGVVYLLVAIMFTWTSSQYVTYMAALRSREAWQLLTQGRPLDGPLFAGGVFAAPKGTRGQRAAYEVYKDKIVFRPSGEILPFSQVARIADHYKSHNTVGLSTVSGDYYELGFSIGWKSVFNPLVYGNDLERQSAFLTILPDLGFILDRAATYNLWAGVQTYVWPGTTLASPRPGTPRR